MRHCLHGLAFDAMMLLSDELRPDIDTTMDWFGQVSYMELQHDKRRAVAKKLTEMWGAEGLMAIALKGQSFAHYYPVPNHRFSCDLDVFIGDGWEDACKLLEADGIKLEREVYKEVEFHKDGVYVECHRFITPLRGHSNLFHFEKYLRSLLKGESAVFSDTGLINPPLMFNVMLYVEHALGDLLQGKMALKHIVDWMVLRKQDVDWNEFEKHCKEFKFDRFVSLVDALADVIEARCSCDDLPAPYKAVIDRILNTTPQDETKESWFKKRVNLFFNIVENRKAFNEFGYCSMWQYLLGSVWTHFFDKKVSL